MPKSKIKFRGRIKKPLLTWKQQGDINLNTGEKVVPREKIVQWVGNAAHKVNQDNRKNRGVAALFRKCGMNPDDLEKEQFPAHLTFLSEDSIYFALFQNQHANDLAL